MDPFNKITDRLYQGSVPDPTGSHEQFSMIVLCAEEVQPELRQFKGTILRPAFNDTSLVTEAEIQRARNAASEVAAELMRGGKVLVTCAAGLNRSGLVNGLALTMTTRMSLNEILRRIRQARGDHALGNQTFVKIVDAATKMRDEVLSNRSLRCLAAGRGQRQASSPRGSGRGR